MDLMKRAMRWVSTIALTITTLWVLILGYRIATGQSRESAVATMIKAGKVALIISFASALGANGAMLHQSMTQSRRLCSWGRCVGTRTDRRWHTVASVTQSASPSISA
ncbi:hypothetical protein FHR61_001013 [Xanthomonas arboricola]|uniref:Uncharacterized protein n=1 Tax=Xanthomonas cannabis TaxID=1885674 RepID=A0ABR6JFM3_9XANT|nr:hypothetical protein [Xanthomonas cannabis]MBB5521187.1 hypothetical protein [Xanthomonas cannabis]